MLDSVYAVVAVDLQPAGALQLPFPVQEWRMRLRQQFHNFGEDFWVPVDMQEEGGVLVGVPGLQLPTIRYDQLARLVDCRVDVPLPDSLYAARRLVSVDSAAVQQDTLFARGVRPVPLTTPELMAYERVDSTWALGNQFRPEPSGQPPEVLDEAGHKRGVGAQRCPEEGRTKQISLDGATGAALRPCGSLPPGCAGASGCDEGVVSAVRRRLQNGPPPVVVCSGVGRAFGQERYRHTAPRARRAHKAVAEFLFAAAQLSAQPARRGGLFRPLLAHQDYANGVGAPLAARGV